MTADPRVALSRELTAADAGPALAALDARRVVVRVPDAPTGPEALTAAAMLVLVTRAHAHVDLDGDADLPPNPWAASTLGALRSTLSGIGPAAAADASTTAVVDVGRPGRGPAASLLVAAQPWTAAVSETGSLPDDDPPAPGAPYGGLLGAGLAAARLFREALRPLGLPAAAEERLVVWNVLDHRRSPAPAQPARAAAAPSWPAVALLACGSVGSSVAAALACEDLTGMRAETVDGDTFDASRNTFRYPASTGSADGPKADWVAGILRAAGAAATPHSRPVRGWVLSRDTPGWDGITVASVDTVDGRYDVADVLARTTVSAAVAGLALHVQVERLGDGLRCPYCDFVDQQPALSRAAAEAAFLGLPETRLVELADDPAGLRQSDLDAAVAAGRLLPNSAAALVGRRVADLQARVYAQGLVPAGPQAPPVPVSAPFVSWVTGVLCAAEVAKAARGLPLLDRRTELDLHGGPDDFVHRRSADTSGRCACAAQVRRRWMRAMYGRLE